MPELSRNRSHAAQPRDELVQPLGGVVVGYVQRLHFHLAGGVTGLEAQQGFFATAGNAQLPAAGGPDARHFQAHARRGSDDDGSFHKAILR